MRTASPFLLPAVLALSAQEDLPAQLARAQALSQDGLRDLQARVAASDAPGEAKAYHDAYLAYALGNHLQGKDPKAASALVARALKGLEGRKDAEALALMGALVTQQLSLDPSQAMVLFPKATGLYDAALAASPTHPRALLLKGIYVLHTPPFAGGGADRALPLLEGARKAAEAEATPKDPWAPRWGRVEASAWLAVAQARAGKVPEAEATLASARALDATHGLLRYAAAQVASVRKPKA